MTKLERVPAGRSKTRKHREVEHSAARPRGKAPIGVRVLTVIAVVVGFSLAAVSAASGQPQRSSAQPQWIAFSGHPAEFGATQIFRIKLSGTGLEQLTRGTFAAGAPAFSPDGKRIAFVRLGDGLFSMNADGTDPRRLTGNGRDSFPTWSPDGKQIAFVRPSTNGWRLHVMSESGAGARELRQAPAAGRPSWTRRGLVIPTEGDLALIDARSGSVKSLFGALIDPYGGVDTAALSPDVSKVTFVGTRAPDPGDKDCGDGNACQRFALYIEDLGKSAGPRILARDAGPASFSPDGKRVAFVAGSRIVLWLLANGTPVTLKTGKVYPTNSTPPAWQPR